MFVLVPKCMILMTVSLSVSPFSVFFGGLPTRGKWLFLTCWLEGPATGLLASIATEKDCYWVFVGSYRALGYNRRCYTPRRRLWIYRLDIVVTVLDLREKERTAPSDRPARHREPYRRHYCSWDNPFHKSCNWVCVSTGSCNRSSQDKTAVTICLSTTHSLRHSIRHSSCCRRHHPARFLSRRGAPRT